MTTECTVRILYVKQYSTMRQAAKVVHVDPDLNDIRSVYNFTLISVS